MPQRIWPLFVMPLLAAASMWLVAPREQTESGGAITVSAPSRPKFPTSGWSDILWRAAVEFNDNRVMAVSAGVTFYAVLALFPAIAAFVSLYGLFADASTIDSHVGLLSTVLPAGGVDIVHEQVRRIAAKGGARLGLGFFFGLMIALWSANAGMKAMMDALNAVHNEQEKRSFIVFNLVAFAFTLGALAAALIALALVAAAPIALSLMPMSLGADVLVRWIRWPAMFLFSMGALAVLYRFGPSRSDPRWQWISFGSAAAALGWLVLSALFSWYLSNFANYDATYGSLGAAIGFMTWIWLSTIVVLVGAQLNSEIERQAAIDSGARA